MTPVGWVVLLGSFWLGPSLFRLWRLPQSRWVERGVAAAVLALVAIHLIPEACRQGGWGAVAAILVGGLAGALLERGESRWRHATVLVSLAVHVGAESAAFANASAEHVMWLGAALALHRIPVGWFVFLATGWWGLVALSFASAAGAWVGQWFLPGGPMPILQGFVAGSLLYAALQHIALPSCPSRLELIERPVD